MTPINPKRAAGRRNDVEPWPIPPGRGYTPARLPIVVMWGRSNGVGHGVTAELTAEEQTQDDRWMEWEHLADPWTEPAEDQVWHLGGIQTRYNTSGAPKTHVFGPDLFTGRGLAARNCSVGVLKYGHGGTNLSSWLPSATDYQIGMRIVREALLALNVRYKISAFVLYNCEGESTAENLAAYPATMDAIIQAVRTDLGAPDLPFIFMGVCNNWTIANAPGLLAVQRNYAATRHNTVLLDTTDYTVITEEDLTRIHFDTNGCKTLGLATADAVWSRIHD